MKTACVIQGDIRRGTDLIIKEMCNHFDLVILSTWVSEEKKIPKGDFKIILNERPVNNGVTNRNLQRLSTSRGLDLARDLCCTHVLKWRTDMLSTNLDVNELLKLSIEEPLFTPFNSKIVTSAFRNLSVDPDWYSSIPDLFAFGSIELLSLLWGDVDFNYSLSMNIPQKAIDQCDNKWFEDKSFSSIYCAETELYALFKDRLQKVMQSELVHPTIVTHYFRLIDHRRLKICWFDPHQGFRSIAQALHHPWWTEQTWKKKNPHIIKAGYPEVKLIKIFWQLIWPAYIKFGNLIQNKWLSSFQKKRSI